MRARQRHPVPRYETGVETEQSDAALSLSAPESEAKDLIAAVLRPFVAQLPPSYREVVLLSELDELPHAVVAERLGMSVSGVKSRVQRGRAQLRQLLERCCQIALDARGAPASCELRPDGVIPPGCCRDGCESSNEPRDSLEGGGGAPRPSFRGRS
jgi:RNA polymerase sigma-70 factor (ECF subfamily)